MASGLTQIFEGLVEYSSSGDIAVLTFIHDIPTMLSPHGTPLFEHRINPDTLKALNDGLEAVLASPKWYRALVLTGRGKFFCNGLDVKWISANTKTRGGKTLEADTAKVLQHQTELLFARLLAFPIPTVASINGHVCAGGAMLALSCDYRVMVESSNAWFFVPGLDINVPYTPGMTSLVKCKMQPHLHRDVLCFSKRFKGKEMLMENIIDALCEKKDGLDEAQTLIQFTYEYIEAHIFQSKSFGEKRFQGQNYRATLQNIKLNTYDEAYFLLTQENESANETEEQTKFPRKPSMTLDF